MRRPANRPDPARLLEAFVASNRCDKAFAALVGSLDGLVYSSALRRTGNAQLAEEVAQNVFAIMAQKAGALRSHPSLTAWALKTTRLQCANAMRSERRRQRKTAALASEAGSRNSQSTNPMDDQATWKDAIPFLDEALDRLSPQDQKLILQRFYEDKKFREIAGQTGQTESACKKRVQRALQKLSSLLTSRGVSLTGTAVASLLGAEFARAAPAHITAAIAPKALAASSSLSATTVVANTIHTMSTLKSTSITAAAVFAFAVIPISQQLAEGSRIRAELREAADPQGSTALAPSKSKRRGGTGRTGTGMMHSRTARGILASFNAPADSRAIFRALLEGEPLESTIAQSRIAMMSADELELLLVDLQDFSCESSSKDSLASKIQRHGLNLHPRLRVEHMVATGRASAKSPMRDWAASEPEAALNWYREKRASGELDPGLKDELHRQVISNLVCGMATTSPEMALDFYREMPREEMGSSIVKQLARALTENLMKTGDETPLSKMLEYHGQEDRRKALEGSFAKFAAEGKYDAGLALVDKYNPDPEGRLHYLAEMFQDVISFQAKEILDWLGTTVTETEGPEIVGRVIAGSEGRRLEANEWLARQSPGAIRDHGYAGLA